MAYDKAVDSTELEAGLAAVADAIRAKGGTSEALVFPAGFVSAVEEIQTESAAPVIQPLEVTQNGTYEAPDGVDGYSPVTVAIESGGGDDIAKALVGRTITEYVNDEVTELGNYSFCGCTKLTNISCANVTSIRNNVFEGCSGLVSAILPRVTQTNNYVFKNCYALTEVVMPELKTVGSTFMQYCNALVSVTLPKLERTQSYTFDSCGNLEFLRLDNCASLDSFGIRSCPKLKTIILGHSSVCSLGGTTQLSGNNLTVYVPQALIESYQTATNWSTLYAAGTCNFVAIEGSEYE